MSKHRLRLKRRRRRERARARAASQPIAAQPVARLNGADIFKSLEKRFDELLAPKTLEETLVGALVSKNLTQ